MGYLKSTSYLNADRIKYGTVDGDRLPAVSTTKKGAVPATGTPAGKYLKDDGTWAAVEGGSHSHDNLTILNGDQESFTTVLKSIYDGYASGKEAANSNIQTHVTSSHAPGDAQKNSDITKAEIEAKLTGEISTHTHAGGGGLSQPQVMSRISLSI